MFALRPRALFARLARGLATARPPPPASISDFLDHDDPDTPGGPTPFDDPPVASPDGYAPAQSSPSFSSTSVARINHPRYRLHCHSSRNNTIVTFTRPDGATVAWLSGGSTPSKFRKANRASYEAGYQCAVGIFQRIQSHLRESGPFKVDLFFKGFGEGREAMKTALLAAEGEEIRRLVSTITDRTPIKIGGTRSKKQRRG